MTWHSMAWKVKVRQGMAWHGKERHGMVRKELHGKENKDMTWKGKVWHGMTWKGKNTSLDGKEICDIKLSHMSLEKMFFISWDEKCSFFCDSCFIAIHILI
jgi:hypothetical protein